MIGGLAGCGKGKETGNRSKASTEGKKATQVTKTNFKQGSVITTKGHVEHYVLKLDKRGDVLFFEKDGGHSKVAVDGKIKALDGTTWGPSTAVLPDGRLIGSLADWKAKKGQQLYLQLP